VCPITNTRRFVTAALLAIAAMSVDSPARHAAMASDEDTSSSTRRLVAGQVTTLLDNIDGGAGGLSIDSQGNLYTADFGWRLDGRGKGGHQIFRISPEGQSTRFFAELRGGSGNTFDALGNLYQSSIGGSFITRITPEGKGTVFCNSGLKSPVGLTFNSKGDLFACNCGGNSICIINAEGKSELFCSSPLLKCPNGITVGPDGTIYVCNFSNGDVIRISTNGKAERLATIPGNNNGHLIYYQGALYVLARTDCRVYRVMLTGETSVFAGSGQRGKRDGAPMTSEFSLPNSLVVSPDGKSMYVNETSPIAGDHRILGPTRIRRIELLTE